MTVSRGAAGEQDVVSENRSMSALNAFVHSANAAVAAFGRDLRCLAASPRFLSDFGLRKPEDESIPDAVASVLPERCRQAQKTCLATGSAERCERDTMPDGHGGTRWVSWEIYPWHEDGEVAGVVCFTAILDAARTMEEAANRFVDRFGIGGEVECIAGVEPDAARGLARRLRDTLGEASERYRLMLDQTRDAILVLDPATRRPLDFNEGYCRLLDCTREEAADHSVDDFQEELSSTELDRHIATVLDRGHANFETRLRTFRGDVRNVRISIRTATIRNRPVLHIVVRDITDDVQTRKRLERSLALQKLVSAQLEQQKYVLDRHAIVATTDPAGRITYVNDKFCEISGYSRDELVGKNHRILKSGHHPASFYESIWRTITSGNVWQGEIKNRAKDGSFYWVLTTIAPMKDDRGRISEYIAIRADITAIKEAELALLAAKEDAEQASRAKSEFLANMSHELRTPLNVILGFSKILETEALGPLGVEKYREYVADIGESGQYLLDLINDILDVSRIETGNMDVEAEDIGVAPLVESCLVLVQRRAEERGIALESRCDDALRVLADPRHVKQILLNLLGNAVKFTSRGGRVVVEAGAATDGDDRAVVRIIDDGIGIAPADLEKVLQPFGQVAGSYTRDHRGMGLGLPLARSLAELNGGALTIESTPGEGTTVSVRLPLCAAGGVAPS